ncbi:MAG: hypothetical protein R2857_05800 [Vampirovibrionales bacterium]
MQLPQYSRCDCLPQNQQAMCLMTQAPGKVDLEQLLELQHHCPAPDDA